MCNHSYISWGAVYPKAIAWPEIMKSWTKYQDQAIWNNVTPNTKVRNWDTHNSIFCQVLIIYNLPLLYIFTTSSNQITSCPNHLSKTALRTYTAEDFRGQVLVKLANDDSHIVVLKKERRHHNLNGKYEHSEALTQVPLQCGMSVCDLLFLQ